MVVLAVGFEADDIIGIDVGAEYDGEVVGCEVLGAGVGELVGDAVGDAVGHCDGARGGAGGS